MYLLSVLLEAYLWHEQEFGNRRMMMQLEHWTAEHIPQAKFDIRADLGFMHNKAIFEEALSMLPEFRNAEINEELLFRAAMDEYRQGAYDSACDYLYYKPYIAEKIGFPYKIEYSGRTDTAQRSAGAPSSPARNWKTLPATGLSDMYSVWISTVRVKCFASSPPVSKMV